MLGRSFYKLAEQAMLIGSRKREAPELFILGLPRSGTTLVYQYAVHRLRFSYFTNGAGVMRFAPCLATRRDLRRHGPYVSDFRSNYGNAKGAVAPHEAGDFWGRFFGFDDYVLPDEISARDARALRRTINCVKNVFGGAPFVNKNVKHMLRIQALHALFPNSVFLLVERDPADVALSILRARHLGGKPEEWSSVKPPDYEELKKRDVPGQVAGQVISLRRRMEADLADLPPEKVLKIHYTDFCREPEQLVRLVRGAIPGLRENQPPVEWFEVVRNEAANPEEARLLALLAAEG